MRLKAITRTQLVEEYKTQYYEHYIRNLIKKSFPKLSRRKQFTGKEHEQIVEEIGHYKNIDNYDLDIKKPASL